MWPNIAQFLRQGVAGALLWRQEAAGAVALGVAVAYARLLWQLAHAMRAPATASARPGDARAVGLISYVFICDLHRSPV